jgi:dihydroorotase
MIDPHVHLRDWNQAAKETLRHGLSVAYRAGLDGVFEMPNTDPPLTSREAIERRIDDADTALLAAIGARGAFLHGMYAGLTAVPRQIEEMARAWKDLFPRVVGLKMFAGQSTGNMGITDPREQALVYRTLAALGYTGVLAVHCEKEALLRPSEWDPALPLSHCRARPPAAEVASVDDQKTMARAAGFRGTLHVCHISTPWALDVLRGTHDAEAAAGGASQAAADASPLKLTCGLTPHHALLDANMMEGPDGLLLKVNPPLRPLPVPALMLRRLLDGDIDWIETDHAPHARQDKLEGHASGIPGLPFYPRFVRLLSEKGLTKARIDMLTHESICRAFGLSVPRAGRAADPDLAREYHWDPFSFREARVTPRGRRGMGIQSPVDHAATAPPGSSVSTSVPRSAKGTGQVPDLPARFTSPV